MKNIKYLLVLFLCALSAAALASIEELLTVNPNAAPENTDLLQEYLVSKGVDIQIRGPVRSYDLKTNLLKTNDGSTYHLLSFSNKYSFTVNEKGMLIIKKGNVNFHIGGKNIEEKFGTISGLLHNIDGVMITPAHAKVSLIGKWIYASIEDTTEIKTLGSRRAIISGQKILLKTLENPYEVHGSIRIEGNSVIAEDGSRLNRVKLHKDTLLTGDNPELVLGADTAKIQSSDVTFEPEAGYTNTRVRIKSLDATLTKANQWQKLLNTQTELNTELKSIGWTSKANALYAQRETLKKDLGIEKSISSAEITRNLNKVKISLSEGTVESDPYRIHIDNEITVERKPFLQESPLENNRISIGTLSGDVDLESGDAQLGRVLLNKPINNAQIDTYLKDIGRTNKRIYPHQEIFFRKVIQAAIKDSQKTGVPASVTIAQAILESNWGRSGLTSRSNNLFGIKAGSNYLGSTVSMPTYEYDGNRKYRTRADFRVYPNWETSISDHSALFNRLERYHPAFKYQNNPDQFAREIHKGGYATDPEYANKLISLMRKYNLYQFDKNVIA